ncbi:MAG: hypothetical protein QF893_23185 [Alphaproteobacteria bacterium]|jgi:hypothetical protein|nr:hypothetical protein [Alphaproteobacteria bacterium]
MENGAAGQLGQRTPIDDLILDRRLDELAQRIADRPEIGDRIARARSVDALQSAFAYVVGELGIEIAPEALARHLELLLRVEPAYYHVKPSVGFDLAELPWRLRLQVGLAFIASRLAIPFDTPPPFGRPLGWLLRLLPRPKGETEPAEVDDAALDWIRPYSAAECAAMRARFDGLGSETWRLHIDWEDQDHGAEVYDLAKHGRQAVDSGYLKCALASHERAARMLGRRLTADAIEVLQRVGMEHNLRRGRTIAVAYHASPRDLWRLAELSEPGALDEVPPRCLRQFKHRCFEAIAFDHLVNRDRQAFERDNPEIAAII